MNTPKNFQCKLCLKFYSSKSSLCNHNKRFHNDGERDKEKVNLGKPKVNIKVNIKSSFSQPEIAKDERCKTFLCKFCNKDFFYKQSKWRHEKNCKIQKEIEDEKISALKEETMKQKQQIIKLQQKLLSSKRLDNKTFKALNKILIERSNVNSNNSTTINNNTINNYNIVSIGNEDLVNVLTMQQKQQILNCRLSSLEKLVEITHCGEINQFKNIIITNLKDNYAYNYDEKKGYFVAVPKNTLLDNLVMLRLTDIEAIYDELKTANKIDTRTKTIIQDFLNRMENEETPVFENDIKYENYKSFKIDSIKILLYNNQDKITKNIALLISDEENITI